MKNFDKYYANELANEKKIRNSKKEYIEQKIYENFNLVYPKKVEYLIKDESTTTTGNYVLSLEKEDMDNRVYWQCIVVEKLLKLNNIPYYSNISNNPKKSLTKDVLIENYTEERLDKYIDDNRFDLERKFDNVITAVQEQSETYTK